MYFDFQLLDVQSMINLGICGSNKHMSTTYSATAEGCLTWKIIRILHELEVLIEKSVPRVTVWHHEAPLSDAKL